MDERSGSHNRFDGRADWVIQGRDFYGNVHIHVPDRPAPPQYQVPTPTQNYTNNEPQLATISDAVARGGELANKAPKVVVVQGPPGGGKSETAYQWLADHTADYPDGQFYVPLVAGPEQSGLESTALRQFLIAVGYDPATIPENLDGRSTWFRSWSTGKRVAVVIDDALTPAQVRPLLPGNGRSVVLVTEAGRLSGLRVREAATFVELDPMRDSSARLLLSRIAGDGRLDDEPEDADELIRLCGGSTIALCVAGAMLAEFPVRPIGRLVRELSREGRRLRTLSRDAELSVRSVLNTAFDRLGADARRCYVAFGTHPGSGDIGIDTLRAALNLAEEDVREILDTLLSRKLIRETPHDRYLSYALVREHSIERAASDPELARDAEVMRDRFSDFYRSRALSAGHAMMPGRGWLERLWPDLMIDVGTMSAEDARTWLEAERANLRALVEQEYRAETAREGVCQLAVALWPLHERGKYLEDLDAVNEHAAEVAEHLGATLAQGVVLVQRGFALRHSGQLDKAAELFLRAHELARQHGHRDVAATAVESLGLTRRDQGDVGEARRLLRDNLELALAIGAPRRVAMAQLHLGSVAHPLDALRLLDEAVTTFRSLPAPDEYNAAKALLWRGKRLIELRRFDDAVAALDGAMEFMVNHHFHFDQAQTQYAFGELALATEDEHAARRHFGEALAICRRRGFAELAERTQSRLVELGAM